MDINLEELVFIDLEASSLAKNSYPISVGWCDFLTDLEDYFLIRPHESWTDWDQVAETIHKLPLDYVKENGISIYEACDRLNSQLTNCHVVTDAIPMDEYWLKRLFNQAGMEMNFDLIDIRNLSVMTEINYKEMFKSIRSEKNHNALDDAKALKNAIKKYL